MSTEHTLYAASLGLAACGVAYFAVRTARAIVGLVRDLFATLGDPLDMGE